MTDFTHCTSERSALPSLAGSRAAVNRSSSVARSLAIGFSTAVAMWVIAYIAMMKPGLVVGEALFVITLACVVVGGFCAGRARHLREGAAIAGAKAGLVTATINMLLVGSLVGGESRAERFIQTALWMTGNFAITIVLASVGAVLSVSWKPEGREAAERNWYSLFTKFAAATVFLLLITGGLVTGLEAGLAVPDWPNSFGHNMLLYPLSGMKDGVYYEHAHRLYGMLVGVTAITLAVTSFFFDARPWFRALAITYLLMVCVQGYLGGTRVTETSISLAIVHGVFGQAVFATACAIAACTSRRWIDQSGQTLDSRTGARTWSTALLIAMFAQLAIGALYRHTLHTHALYAHILWAAMVTSLIVFVGGRMWSRPASMAPLPGLGKATIYTVGFQLVLGVIAMFAVWSRPSEPPMVSGQATPLAVIPLWEVAFTSAHHTVGAVLLALATLLALWMRRLSAPTSQR